MINEIFYSECLICGSEISYKKIICDSCLELFDKVNFKCKSCGYPLNIESEVCKNCLSKGYIDNLIIPFWYDKNMRRVIRYFKFGYGLKGKGVFYDLTRNVEVDVGYDLVVPVPVYFIRKFRRFIHPAYVLANVISGKMDINCKNVLKRIKNTEYQWKLKRNRRVDNVKGAFTVCAQIKGLKILLVDDIMTTGATVNECARVLKKAGAKKVDVFCLCKGYFS